MLAAGAYMVTKRRIVPQSESSGSGAMPAGYRPPPPPVKVPLPVGWVHMADRNVNPEIVAFAQSILKEMVEDPSSRPYGYFREITINGKPYAAIVEPHYDNHVSANYKWHPGVSILRKGP